MSEVADNKATNQSITDQAKIREAVIDELKKQISQWESKLRQQQQLYEAVRSDRNHYSKGVIEAQDEIAELRKKFKIMGHQIEQVCISYVLWECYVACYIAHLFSKTVIMYHPI